MVLLRIDVGSVGVSLAAVSTGNSAIPRSVSGRAAGGGKRVDVILETVPALEVRQERGKDNTSP